MKLITSIPGQNPIAASLQSYGTIEALFELMRDNNLGWDEIPAGTGLLIRERGEIAPEKTRTAVVLGLASSPVIKEPIPAPDIDALILHGSTNALLLTTNQPLEL
jgi:hypothetical protein